MSYQVYYCTAHPEADYIVLSSGLGGHAAFWSAQLPMLQQHFHVITYDHAGCHADSALLPYGYSMQDLAQQVLDILLQQQIDAVHFIGHALGGHIGAELATLLPEQHIRLLSLTAINAWDRLDPHTHKCFQARIALLQHAGVEAYVRAQALFLYPPAYISQNSVNIRHAENNQILDFPPTQNVMARLSALQAFQVTSAHAAALEQTKIHLIANCDDFLVPYQKSDDLQQTLGHGKISLFEHGAHASTITETEKVNTAILDFLLHL